MHIYILLYHIFIYHTFTFIVSTEPMHYQTSPRKESTSALERHPLRERTSNGLMVGLEIVWLLSEDGIQKQGQGGVP
jgi:hypothetical protein